MMHEEVKKYRELSGDINPNTPISRIGGYLDGYEKVFARSIAQTSGVSMNEAMQAICLAMRALPPLGDAEIAMIRNNPSLNIFQKWWLIHKIKKRRILE